MRRSMLLAFSLCLVAAGGAAGEPVSVALCTSPVPSVVLESLPPVCVAAAADATGDEVTVAAGASSCTVVVSACADVTAAPRLPVTELAPLHVVRTPAAGTIKIVVTDQRQASMTLDGVFTPALGHFTCVLTTSGPATVRCTPNVPTAGWYCAGWVLTAGPPPPGAYLSSGPGYVRGQVSCDGTVTEAPSGGPRTLSTRPVYSPVYTNDTHTVTALGLDWDVDTAIVCQAWGDPGGDPPVAPSMVTCSEPGAAL